VAGDTLTLQVGADVLALRVWRTNMVEVDYRPNGSVQPVTDVIGATNGTSPDFTLDTNGTPLVHRHLGRCGWRSTARPAACACTTHTGTNLLLREQAAEGVFGDGLRLHTPRRPWTHYGINAYYVWDDTSPRLLRNSGGAVEAGYQGDAGAPMVWTRNGFGLLVDSDGGQFTISGTNLTYQYVSKINILYYIATGEPADILAAFYELSGRPPLLPKWSLGFANTEWGITQAELTNIVAAYRQKQIPIDHYILDFDWKAWGQDNYGEWRWNTTKFPDGPSGALMTNLAARGIRLSGIMKPRVHVNTVQGDYATTHGFWWPGQSTYSDYFSGQPVKDINFALPDARAWFFDHITNAFATGIQGWWSDEADQAGGGGILFGNWQFLNMQKALYEGQRSITSQRVWSINRNFYLGSQRYAYAMWSGDIDGGFAAMARERERMLSSINIGAVKWGMDIGGFNNGGLTTSECYARWMQFGAVVPVYRVHGQENNQRQPWVYGVTAEAAAKAAIRLRYQLLPYLYSYERATYETGIGLVRPLVFQFPDDDATANHVASWMVGDHLLASPVVAEGATSHAVYLPAGTWYDFFRGGAHQGPQTLAYAVNSATWTDLPLFVRAGAILPMQPVMNHVGESPLTNLTIEVFPDWTPSSFSYYDDDGETYAYEGGAWYRQELEAALEDGHARFTAATPTGPYAPPLAHLECRLHAPTGTAVQVNGVALAPFADLAAFSNSTAEGWASGSDRFGPVTYVRVAAQAARSIIVSNDWLAPPAFSPAGGTFSGPTLLSLSAPNADATIRFTSDGTEPTEASPAYVEPFLVWTSATYRARAFLPGRSPSAVAAATLTIDYNQLLNPGFEQQGATTNHPYYWHGGDPDLHGEVFGSAGRVSWRSHGGTWQGTVRGTWAGSAPRAASGRNAPRPRAAYTSSPRGSGPTPPGAPPARA
jgi:alpha-glucosidase